jgi:octanoyl-[GcvH]:protein N-octanoyltransferase
VELYTHSEADPLLDVAVSHALLERAARGDGDALRLWRPARAALSLGRLDVRHHRAAELAAVLAEADMTAVRRLTGGRAAVVDAGCLCIGFAQGGARLQESGTRYQLMTNVIVDALRELGVRACVGEVRGEWCPGAWSVQGPTGKLAGIAQRLIAGAAWSEALIVVERSQAAHSLSRRVHELLDIPWRDEAQGELLSLVSRPPDLHDRVSDALVRAVGGEWSGLEERSLPDAVGARALELRLSHRWP